MTAAVVVLAGSVAHAPTAAATADSSTDTGYVGFRLLEAPVVRHDDPRALKYIVDHLKPGTVISRRFEVANKSNTGREVQLYSGAARIKHNRFVFAEGNRPNELTRWTRVRPSIVRLKPWEKAEAKVTIRVPDAARPGERYAVVWAQSEAAPDAEHNVGSIMRVGTRVYLDISNSGEYADFRISKIIALRDKKGVPSIVAHVHNTGKRALDLRGKFSLSDGPGGLSAGARPVTEGTTLPPGGWGTVRVDGLDKSLPAGPWTARMELESGMVRHSLSVRLTFPKPGGSSVYDIVMSSDRRLWAAGAGIMLAVSAASMSFVRYRRRRAARNRT
ncbi:peptidase [Streptomyces olivochromogenes]|uniref:peptidase n=1 Tax=Streptomyces olivochromogenes TaxID=1963 RepID=UPI001F3A0A92|nr:peptidase [Streptomyces olivochromogenes]MCF3131200.1 peptidase [Streptomyces olivochromogenes]